MSNKAKFEYLKQRVGDLLMEARGLHREIEETINTFDAESGESTFDAESGKESEEVQYKMGMVASCPRCGVRIIIADSGNNAEICPGDHIDFVKCNDCELPFICLGHIIIEPPM